VQNLRVEDAFDVRIESGIFRTEGMVLFCLSIINAVVFLIDSLMLNQFFSVLLMSSAQGRKTSAVTLLVEETVIHIWII
jgi:hypothetical protein